MCSVHIHCQMMVVVVGYYQALAVPWPEQDRGEVRGGGGPTILITPEVRAGELGVTLQAGAGRWHHSYRSLQSPGDHRPGQASQ